MIFCESHGHVILVEVIKVYKAFKASTQIANNYFSIALLTHSFSLSVLFEARIVFILPVIGSADTGHSLALPYCAAILPEEKPVGNPRVQTHLWHPT